MRAPGMRDVTRRRRMPHRQAGVAVVLAVAVVGAVVASPAVGSTSRTGAGSMAFTSSTSNRTGGPTISSFGIGSPTAQVRVNAAGFPPGDEIELFFDLGNLASGRAGGQGSVALTLQVPG